MKFISWNIDSLNAALTGSSERAGLSRQVLADLAPQNAERSCQCQLCRARPQRIRGDHGSVPQRPSL